MSLDVLFRALDGLPLPGHPNAKLLRLWMCGCCWREAPGGPVLVQCAVHKAVAPC